MVVQAQSPVAGVVVRHVTLAVWTSNPGPCTWRRHLFGGQRRGIGTGRRHGQGLGAKGRRNSARARVRGRGTAEQRMGQTLERAIGARARLWNEGASRGQSFGAWEQRADGSWERESAHKPGFDARERRAGKGWFRLVCFHRLRVRYASLVPVVWCWVILCRGRLLTTAALPPLHELKMLGKNGTEGPFNNCGYER